MILAALLRPCRALKLHGTKRILMPHIFSCTNGKDHNAHGIRIDEESIKRKMEEIRKRRKGQNPEQNNQSETLMRNYKVQKVKPQTMKFREATNSQNLFNIEDVTLDQKPTTLQVTSYDYNQIEVDNFSYPPSIILTPHQLLLWELQSVQKMEVKHLRLIELLNPPPVYVIIGCNCVEDVGKEIREYLSGLGVNFDIIEMFEAISNFNTYATDELPLIAFLISRPSD